MRPYLAWSMALHTAVMTAILGFSSPDGARKTPVYHIDFVGPTAVASQGAAPQAKTPEAAASAAAQAKAAEFQTRRYKRSKPLPRPSLLSGFFKKQKPQPEAQPAKGDAGDQASTPGSAGVATDMPNFPYPWFISQIRARLWNQWSAGMPSQPGQAVVVFTLLPHGQMVDLKIESSSGDGGFDLAALSAAQDAGPYPPLPPGFDEPFLKIHVTLAGGAK